MKAHLLLIDDDKDELAIVCEALDHTGIPYKCTWAQGVEHAMKMLAFMQPDIILIDLNMPVVNGIEGIRSIRTIPALQHIPVILYSNNVGNWRAEALSAGANQCFKKPDALKDLTALFTQLLQTVQPPQNAQDEIPQSSDSPASAERIVQTNLFKQ